VKQREERGGFVVDIHNAIKSCGPAVVNSTTGGNGNFMSRPQKIHPPLKADFNKALAAVAMGSGRGKRAALSLQRNPQKPPTELEARSAAPTPTPPDKKP